VVLAIVLFQTDTALLCYQLSTGADTSQSVNHRTEEVHWEFVLCNRMLYFKHVRNFSQPFEITPQPLKTL